MAARGLDLGDVSFGLLADTAGLDRALQKLSTFGDKVDSVAKRTGEGAAQTTAAYVRQEKAIVSAYNKVVDLNQQIRATGAGSSQITTLTHTFNSIADTLTKGELSSQKFARAQSQIASRLAESKRALEAFQDQQKKGVSVENSLSRASLLVGSRGATFERLGAPGAFGTQNSAALSSYQSAVASAKGNPAAMAAAQREFNAALSATDNEYKKWLNDLRQVESLQSQINRLGRQGQRFGSGGAGGAQLNAQLAAYQSALAGGNQSGANAALNTLKANIAAVDARISGATATAGKWSYALRDMERASVLALGPLSGIGSRMAVLAALFESTSIKHALFIAGTVGTAAALTTVGIEAVKTTMKFQQWNAMMIASSGASVLVADDLKYVIEQSNKFGQQIEVTIPSFTKFAASARLSGMAFADQKKTFEAFLTAGSALHWSTEQTGNAFLALEQIMAKGTVQSEEIKKQLGNVLPGAFELAAAAVGKTTSEFADLLKKGDLLSTDFMPKFSTLIEKVFRAGSAQGQGNLLADINRTKNSLDLLYKAFDETVHVSKAFQAVMQGVNKVLQTLTANMDKMLPSLGALAGFFIGMSAPAVIAGMMGLVRTLGAAVALLKEGATVMSVLSVVTIPWTGALSLAVRLLAGLGVGAGAYALMSEKTNKTVQETQDYVKALGESISALKGVESVTKSVHDRINQQHQKQLAAINAEIGAQMALINAQKPTVIPGSGRGNAGRREIPVSQEVIGPMQDKILALGKARADIEKLMKEFNTIKVVDDPANKPKVDSHLKNLKHDIQELLNSIDELRTAQSSLMKGESKDDEPITHAKALQKALDFVDKIESKSNQGALSAMLKAAGHEGKNLTEQLTHAYEVQGRLTAQNRSITKSFEAQNNAQAKINEATDQYNALIETGDKAQGAIAKKLSVMEETLDKAKVSQELRNSLLKEYSDILQSINKAETGIEDKKKLLAANEKIDKYLGNHKASIDAVNKKYDDMRSVIERAGESQERLALRTAAIEKMRTKDLNETMMSLEPALKTVHDTLNKIADSGAKSLVDMFNGVAGSANNFFRGILEQLQETIVKLFIIKPLMQAAFGSSYDTSISGDGLLGGILKSGLKTIGIGNYAPVTTSVPVPVGHAGWSVGSLPSATRNVASSIFNSAPRLHNGLAPDEFPAILQRGEAVLTKKQQESAAQNSGGNMTAHIYVQAQKGATEQDGQNVGKGVTKELEAFMNQWALKNKRPGGIFAS